MGLHTEKAQRELQAESCDRQTRDGRSPWQKVSSPETKRSCDERVSARSAMTPGGQLNSVVKLAQGRAGRELKSCLKRKMMKDNLKSIRSTLVQRRGLQRSHCSDGLIAVCRIEARTYTNCCSTSW